MSLDLCLIISILDSKKIDFEKSSIADIFSPNLSFKKPQFKYAKAISSGFPRLSIFFLIELMAPS